MGMCCCPKNDDKQKKALTKPRENTTEISLEDYPRNPSHKRTTPPPPPPKKTYTREEKSKDTDH